LSGDRLGDFPGLGLWDGVLVLRAAAGEEAVLRRGDADLSGDLEGDLGDLDLVLDLVLFLPGDLGLLRGESLLLFLPLLLRDLDLDFPPSYSHVMYMELPRSLLLSNFLTASFMSSKYLNSTIPFSLPS
jgi:hypothetical protein